MPAFLLAYGASVALTSPSLMYLAASRLVQASRRLCTVQSSAAPGRGLVNIYAMDDRELEALLKSLGAQRFRAKQIREWVYDRNTLEFDEMFNLPKKLRHQLQFAARVGDMNVQDEQQSRDGTRKRLWRLHDGQLIESVLMPYKDNRRTACISSQVGCAMGCTFCATGQMGYKRQLTATEIFEQAARFSAELRAQDERLSNVVFMGMGEPFRNFDAVMTAARRIMSELGIGSRHITFSTVGLVPEIRRFADICADEGLEIKLAISLHAASNEARGAMMPVNRKYPIEQLIDACRYYVERSGRRISFEWALIAGQNDGVEEARELAGLLRGLKAHVNLIPLNPTQGFGGRTSATANAELFVRELNKAGLSATVRVRRGIDIDAGCGQLADKSAAKDQDRSARKSQRAPGAGAASTAPREA